MTMGHDETEGTVNKQLIDATVIVRGVNCPLRGDL